MIKLKTNNPILLEARERARHYFISTILNDHPLSLELIDDIINLTESRFPKIESGELEINEKTVSDVYSKIYNPIPEGVIPVHMLKGNDSDSQQNVLSSESVPTSENKQISNLKIVK